MYKGMQVAHVKKAVRDINSEQFVHDVCTARYGYYVFAEKSGTYIKVSRESILREAEASVIQYKMEDGYMIVV